MKQHYYVTYRIDARYVVDVVADNIDEAKRLSESAFTDADFGEAFDIDGEPIIVEDENGDFVWEA